MTPGAGDPGGGEAARLVPWFDSLVLAAAGALGIRDGIRVIRAETQNLDAVISGAWVAAVGLLLILLVAADWIRTKRIPAAASADGRQMLRSLAPGLWVTALLAAFTVLLTTLGYLLCTALFVATYMRGFGHYRWWVSGIGGLAFAVLSVWVFGALRVQMPPGLIGWP